MLTDKKVRLEIPEQQIRDLLLEREVGITVSEPWDFEYPDGARMMTGHITDAGADSEQTRSQWVEVALGAPFVSVAGEPLGVKVGRLKATRRHVSERGLLEQLLAGDYPSVNLDFGDQVSEEEMPGGGSPFLIGTIALGSVWAKSSGT